MARRLLHDLSGLVAAVVPVCVSNDRISGLPARNNGSADSSQGTSLDQSFLEPVGRLPHKHFAGRVIVRLPAAPGVSDVRRDRKSTRLNSSHSQISYAVFCLK